MKSRRDVLFTTILNQYSLVLHYALLKQFCEESSVTARLLDVSIHHYKHQKANTCFTKSNLD